MKTKFRRLLGVTLGFVLVFLAGVIFSQSAGNLISSAVVTAKGVKTENADWGSFSTYFQGETYGTRDALSGVAVIKPGQEIHPPHQHAEEEFLMVAEGEGMWHLNGKDFAAQQGDMLYAAPWDVHGIKNTGKAPLKFVVWKWNNKGVALPKQPTESNDWISLFDGKTLNGWKAAENKSTWRVEDGALVCKGPRSHLFYAGNVKDHNFKNFELVAEVKTTPGSNSGIYFHTEYQETGWPAKGYECQVINSNPETKPGEYVERKMTGSLYAIRNVWKAPVPDNIWFNYRIVVQGKTMRTYINDELMAEYTEPDKPFRPEDKKGRLISSGTFALQGHDPKSVVYYKNIKVKPLPDDLPTPGAPLEDADYDRKLTQLANDNFPLLDLHVHLKGGLEMEPALANARKYGFTYGLAVNCGLQMGFETDAAVEEYIAGYKKPPHAFFAMQAEGREWLDMFSKETIAKFDYVFTDAMTWTNDNGKRMRLWIKEELEIGDPQNFMDQLVNRIEKILSTEPIDLYANATYIPDELNHRYDELWTPERMDRVIKALVDNKVAMEINDRRKIPSAAFIKRAKAAGVKFTFGTNNAGGDDLGRLSYCIAMVEECGLTPNDMWMPHP
jgi:mannose-6-phosphate isomerase-like protein (cupin superfamily)